jgi:soluble lytic murein transglycosylase-like protein
VRGRRKGASDGGATRGLLRFATMLALTLPAMSARADVIEIGADGGVTAYNAAGIYRDGTFEPIAPAAGRAASPQGDIGQMLSAAATRFALDPALLRRVAWEESRYQTQAMSPKGAFGVMQLMPQTARELGVDRYDPAQNILGGALYLRQMLDRYGGDLTLALAAYNAGPGAVDRHRGVPPFAQTTAYVQAVLGEPLTIARDH